MSGFGPNVQPNGPIEADINGFDPTNPDSILLVGSEDGTKIGIKHAVRVDSALDARVAISNGANKAGVNVSGEVSVIDAAARAKLDAIIAALGTVLSVSDAGTQALLAAIIASLTSISGGIPASLGQKPMAQSQPVVIASDQTPVKISGTENGLSGGPEFTFVNNRRSQILAAKDRDQIITYANFGTKDQRVTRIDYVAPSIGTGAGFTARKDLTYVLDSGKYRRTNITWSIV